MAFDKTKLTGNTGAGAGVPTLFLYTTEDAATLVEAPGYFNDISIEARVDDLIITQVKGAGFMISRIDSIPENSGPMITVTEVQE